VRRLIDELPPRLAEIARHLHQRAVDDDRTWLEVQLQAMADVGDGATLEEVLAGRHTRGPSVARREAWYVIKNRSAASYPAIGKAYGGVHHTTIMAGVKKREAELAAEREQLDEVEKYSAAAAPPATPSADQVGTPKASAEEYSAAGDEQLALDWERILRKRAAEGLPLDGGRTA
jgi:hypothetical protein